LQPQFWTDTNWTLIISIIAGSAALAYAGDVLGFKYGKQRISIFGLRPRYTSRIITAFTGILISVVVLAILSFFSEGVRTALFRMRAIQQEMSLLTTQLYTMALNLDMTRFDMDILRQERDMLSNEKSDMEAMVSYLRYETEELRLNLERMRLGAITVQINSLLAQEVILPGSTRDSIERVLVRLEESAREEVADKRSERLHTVSVDVVLAVFPEERDGIVARGLDSQERLFVRLLAAENTAMDEVVTVRLESGVSHLLYLEGETIHRRLVNPQTSGFDAEEVLHIFLRELRAQAIRNGVRPDPATYSVGSLDGEDFFETVEALRSTNAPAIINAVALEDIYTEGPVRIRILLE